MSDNNRVVVIGAGVVGLSTALKLQERGYVVTVLAETFPSDRKTIRYTSHWAGAHHVSQGDATPRHKSMESETFRVMWDMSIQEAEGCFLRIPQTEYFSEKRAQPHILADMPNFRYLKEEELVPGSVEGVTFETVTIDVPIYLNWLLARFLSKGGRIIRAVIQHVNQVVEGAFCATPNVVVVCAGIGARFLGGVEDKNVHPIRGQTLLIKAPWIKFGRTLSSMTDDWTYIIPRRSGDVIIGGTKLHDDWYPYPRAETTLDICNRALKLCPELVTLGAGSLEPTYENLKSLIIEEGCGFRPGRIGGIRLEVEVLNNASTGGKNIPMVFNYGHSGAGYQSSWGSARIAADLVDEAMGKMK